MGGIAKILIVDDDSHIRELVGLNLVRNGYDVIEAEDGKQALQQLDETKVDLVVLDIMMPNVGLGYVIISAILVIACSFAISWIFAFFGVIARTASSVQGISMIILFPLTFLSNAFVPVDTMPRWLQWFVKINPISHLITAVRNLTNHGVIGSDLIISLLGAAVVMAIFAPLTVRAYMRRA